MFKRKTKTDAIIQNKKQIQKNVNDLQYIKEVLINVYNDGELASELDELIGDLKYINPSNNELALQKHIRLDQLSEDVKRLFNKFSLELNIREFQKLLKKIKLEIYERKNL